jgi:hypothetical protein
MGSAGSGITAHPRGWNIGVRVDGSRDFEEPERDRFEVRLTGGSGGHGSWPLVTARDIGAGMLEIRYFTPGGDTLALVTVDKATGEYRYSEGVGILFTVA